MVHSTAFCFELWVTGGLKHVRLKPLQRASAGDGRKAASVISCPCSALKMARFLPVHEDASGLFPAKRAGLSPSLRSSQPPHHV